MRLPLLLCCLLLGLAALAQAPLARPAPPTVEIKGQPGTRTVYYWAFARDKSGHSAYSDPAVVTNAPDVLSADNAVVLTPAPVAGAAEYGILTSRCDAPRTANVEIGAKGETTVYYWFQARNGRGVWSPVAGPLKVDGCAETPENTLAWAPTGAEYYYLYRTATPAMPVGWRACALLAGGKETTWSDKGLAPVMIAVNPAGNPAEKPEGQGLYLLGTSDGKAITDSGQALTFTKIYDMNTTDPAFTPYRPTVTSFEPGGETGAFMLTNQNRVKTPQYSWDMVNAMTIHQDNIAGGLNAYPRNWTIERENGKNTYNGIDIHQFNYTPGQHSPYLTFMYNYGLGDNVFLHMAGEQHGQNRTGGDEGTEFFSLHMTRRLSANRTTLGADAKAGTTFLAVGREIGTVAGA
ncbi:MAG TPA: hypothetical protein PLZ36_13515, partial [Armatimonadota bacterium]|nr:hypothetical protein [Armatimonadota bacterium]